jgi:hypothetical protein
MTIVKPNLVRVVQTRPLRRYPSDNLKYNSVPPRINIRVAHPPTTFLSTLPSAPDFSGTPEMHNKE